MPSWVMLVLTGWQVRVWLAQENLDAATNWMATHPPHVPPLPGLGEGGRGERAALKKDVDMALGY
jgi:hypothetical protein